MSNKELYKKTFSKLHVSQPILMEEQMMNKNKNLHTVGKRMKRAMAACAVIVVLTSSAFAVNAVTQGKFFDSVKVFVNGQEVDTSAYGENASVDDIISNLDISAQDEVIVSAETGELPYSIEPQNGKYYLSLGGERLDVTEEIKSDAGYLFTYELNGAQYKVRAFGNDQGGLITIDDGINGVEGAENTVRSQVQFDVDMPYALNEKDDRYILTVNGVETDITDAVKSGENYHFTFQNAEGKTCEADAQVLSDGSMIVGERD